MKTIPVHLKERSYDIILGSIKHGLGRKIKTIGFSPPHKILIVTSANLVKAGHLKSVVTELKRSGFDPGIKIIPDHESQKNHAVLLSLYRAGLAAGLDRKSLIVAVGGGVVTDVAGFFAATHMRGLSYVSIPTTLLGMVDASIGGKTAVDLPEGKNLVGAFWQPRLVWIDPDVLCTLPAREWKTGMAEVVKYGVIRDWRFFEWLEKRTKQGADVRKWKRHELERVILNSAGIKAGVVSRDEKETPLRGEREILNFGHTFGHALEAATGYKILTHGEAISIGMVAAGRLALEKGHWSRDAQLRLVSLLEALGLPIRFPPLTKNQWAKFWTALFRDKKNVAGKLRFVLPIKIGSVKVMGDLPKASLNRVIDLAIRTLRQSRSASASP